MELHRQRRGLRFAAGIVIASGFLIVLGAHPATGLPVRMLVDLLVWPMDSGETLSGGDARLLAAISGGVLAGWGLMIWHLAGSPLERDPDGIRRAITQATLIWFVVDTGGSIAAGAPLNGVSNLLYLWLLLWPLRRVRRPQPA